MAEQDPKKNPIVRGLEDAWRNCVLGLKFFLYGWAVVFTVIGVIALFGGAVGLGIFLIALNVALFLLFRKLDRKSDSRFEEDFNEMVRRNRNESDN